MEFNRQKYIQRNIANIENLNPQPLDATVSNGDMQSDTLALTVA